MRRAAYACAAAALLAVIAAHGRGSASDGACGLGPPPGAPGFAEAQARDEADLRKNGYLPACEASLARYDLPLLRAAALADVAFPPVELARTPFAGFESAGAWSESVNDTRSRLYRAFRTPDGHTLVLFEHDMSADGSSSWRAAQFEQERVNGSPARLVVLRAPSGRMVSSLTWTEGRRSYELWLDGNDARHPAGPQLLALAAALPRSVPACPNEAPVAPPRLGPDGMPEIGPIPAVLTGAEVAAALEKSGKSCK
ncbi:hypothetical protein RugamoR1_19950 [Rugamonas sp. R1(2021)]